MKGREIWKNYQAAMSRRRPDSVLPIRNFLQYIKTPSVTYHSHGGSFLFGKVEYGIFFPSHFAPKGPKSAVKLLKILRRKIPTIFCVTPDLADMLQRLGYKRLPLRIFCDFRGTKVQKVVLVSRATLIPKAIFIFFGKEKLIPYFRGVKEIFRNALEALGKIFSRQKIYKVSIDEDTLYGE